MSQAGEDDYRPTIDDVDPSALAVNSVDDDVRVAADPSETEIVDSAGQTQRVDQDSRGGTAGVVSGRDQWGTREPWERSIE